MEIGQVIKKIRNNKSITQQALADAIGMTRPYIARIESGKNSISSDKLTEILDFCNVTYNEFFFMKNEYKITSKMDLFNHILKLYYANKFDEITKFKLEVDEKYKENGDIFLRQLYILCHCMENKLEITNINKEYINEIADYLLSIDEWCYHELALFNNFLFLFPPTTAFMMTRNLLARAEIYKGLNSDSRILSYLLFNLLELSIKHEEYKYTKLILESTKKYFSEPAMFFEHSLILYYEGMLSIVNNSRVEGMEKCNRAFTVFQALGHDQIYQKHKKDLDCLLKKIEQYKKV